MKKNKYLFFSAILAFVLMQIITFVIEIYKTYSLSTDIEKNIISRIELSQIESIISYIIVAIILGICVHLFFLRKSKTFYQYLIQYTLFLALDYIIIRILIVIFQLPMNVLNGIEMIPGLIVCLLAINIGYTIYFKKRRYQ